MCDEKVVNEVKDELAVAISNVLRDYPIDLEVDTPTKDHFLVGRIVTAVTEVAGVTLE